MPGWLFLVSKIEILVRAIGKSVSVFDDKMRVKEKRWAENEHQFSLRHIKKRNPRPERAKFGTFCAFDRRAGCDIM
jgi:hypothetical protein